MLKRYGWIAILAVSCWSAGRRGRIHNGTDPRRAEPLAMRICRAVCRKYRGPRRRVRNIEATSPRAACLLGMLQAAEQAEAGEDDAAVATLNGTDWTRCAAI